MTVIECFSSFPIKNVMTSLLLKPDKVIYLGHTAQINDAIEQHYRPFLKSRLGDTLTVESREIGSSLQETVAAVTAIAESDPTCIFDVEGGDDLTLVAIGMVIHAYRGRAVFRLCRTNIADGSLRFLSENGDQAYARRFKPTIRDMIELHGGGITATAWKPSPDDDMNDVHALWSMASQDNRRWNRQVSALLEVEGKLDMHGSTKVTVRPESFSKPISKQKQKLETLAELLNDLQRHRLISDYNPHRTPLQYAYKNKLIHKILSAHGNILEFKLLYEAYDLQSDGVPVFDECLMGVKIDWDGAGGANITNEIDVIALRGMTPVFISCKNGVVDEAEVYKLAAVAERFGGLGAKKILVVTDLPESKRRAAEQRTAMMGITLVTDAHRYDKERWQALFTTALGLS